MIKNLIIRITAHHARKRGFGTIVHGRVPLAHEALCQYRNTYRNKSIRIKASLKNRVMFFMLQHPLNWSRVGDNLYRQFL